MPIPFCLNLQTLSRLLVCENDIVGSNSEGEKVFGGLVNWRRSVAETPPVGDVPVENSSFVLAEQRTHRRDPLDGYKKYIGGWNISNEHYWAVSSPNIFS